MLVEHPRRAVQRPEAVPPVQVRHRARHPEREGFGADFAILTDMSAACGTQVISDGCRFDTPRRYQRGVGVAAATLIRAGVRVVAQRDFATLARLRTRAEPGYTPPPDARDHHEHPWVSENLPGGLW